MHTPLSRQVIHLSTGREASFKNLQTVSETKVAYIKNRHHSAQYNRDKMLTTVLTRPEGSLDATMLSAACISKRRYLGSTPAASSSKRIKAQKFNRKKF